MKLLQICAYLAELAIILAMTENVILADQPARFLNLALAALGLLALCCFWKRQELRPSVLLAFGVAGLTSLKVAIARDLFWHDSLVNHAACLLESQDLVSLIALCGSFALCAATFRGRHLERNVSLLIYAAAFAAVLWLVSSAKADTIICAPDVESSKSLAAFFLPWVMFVLGAISSRQAGRLTSTPLQIFPWICAGVFSAVVGLAASQAWLQQPRFDSLSRTIPDHLLLPLLISEDPIFFRHNGIDFSRIQEAVGETVESGEFGRGGSTLSMQLFKVKSGQYQKTLWRKLVQTFGGFWLESRYSKAEILNEYLESVSFGKGIVGLTKAAQFYFSRDLAQLTREQSLQLILTIYDPERYTPALKTLPPDVGKRLAVIQGRLRSMSATLRTQ